MNKFTEIKGYYFTTNNLLIHTFDKIENTVIWTGYRCIHLSLYVSEFNSIEQLWANAKSKKSPLNEKKNLKTRITEACNDTPDQYSLLTLVCWYHWLFHNWDNLFIGSHINVLPFLNKISCQRIYTEFNMLWLDESKRKLTNFKV
jgi:hypothetical protein